MTTSRSSTPSVDQLTDRLRPSETVDLPTNPRTTRPVGYAFVNVSTASEAERAIGELSGKSILDRKVSMQLAKKLEHVLSPAAVVPTTETQRTLPDANGSSIFSGFLASLGPGNASVTDNQCTTPKGNQSDDPLGLGTGLKPANASITENQGITPETNQSEYSFGFGTGFKPANASAAENPSIMSKTNRSE